MARYGKFIPVVGILPTLEYKKSESNAHSGAQLYLAMKIGKITLRKGQLILNGKIYGSMYMVICCHTTLLLWPSANEIWYNRRHHVHRTQHRITHMFSITEYPDDIREVIIQRIIHWM